jgi:uncharacterized protein (DUF1778 family)
VSNHPRAVEAAKISPRALESKLLAVLTAQPQTVAALKRAAGVKSGYSAMRRLAAKGLAVKTEQGFALPSVPKAGNPTLTRTADEKARVSLPQSFANATVLIEQVSDTELRIRKARVIPEDEIRFREESAAPLSDRDRDLFLSLLDNPPAAAEALKKAAEEEKRSDG